jgi:hypothetical protein
MNNLAELEPSRQAPAQECISSVLSGELTANAALRRGLAAALKQGKLCVIRDAFAEGFADGVAEALQSDGGWRSCRDLDQPFFHYSHHVLGDPEEYGGELLRCFQIFASERTRAFMTRLCGVDCGGEAAFGASLYLPGDYLLPHSGQGGSRSVAYMWYLSRDWDVRWGGHLFWCPTGTHVKPTFNTLVLFRVSAQTMHLVCPVSPFAQSRGLAVNGWWTRSHPRQGRQQEARPGARDADWVWSRGAPATELAPGVFVF